jgi:hypothetical protein
MAAATEKALLTPTKKLKTADKVVASIQVPKDTPFTLSKAPSSELKDIKLDANNQTPTGNIFPVTFTINKSKSLEAVRKWH